VCGTNGVGKILLIFSCWGVSFILFNIIKDSA